MAHFLSQNWLLNRRHVLRGLGVSLALPLLDCMRPLRAAETQTAGQAQRLHLSAQRREHDRLSDHAGRGGLQVLEVAAAAGEAPGQHHADQRAASSARPRPPPQLQHDLAHRRQDRAVGTEHHLGRSAHGAGDRAADALLVARTEQPGALARVQRRRHSVAGAGQIRASCSANCSKSRKAASPSSGAACSAAAASSTPSSTKPARSAANSARTIAAGWSSISPPSARSRFARERADKWLDTPRPKVDPGRPVATESRRLAGAARRVSPHDVRHHRARLPDRPDARGHLQHGQRRAPARPSPRSASSRIGIRCRTTTPIPS